jgi:hypothetical protein
MTPAIVVLLSPINSSLPSPPNSESPPPDKVSVFTSELNSTAVSKWRSA